MISSAPRGACALRDDLLRVMQDLEYPYLVMMYKLNNYIRNSAPEPHICMLKDALGRFSTGYSVLVAQ